MSLTHSHNPFPITSQRKCSSASASGSGVVSVAVAPTAVDDHQPLLVSEAQTCFTHPPPTASALVTDAVCCSAHSQPYSLYPHVFPDPTPPGCLPGPRKLFGAPWGYSPPSCAVGRTPIHTLPLCHYVHPIKWALRDGEKRLFP